MKSFVAFILFVSTALWLNGSESKLRALSFAEVYLLKTGEQFAIETMKLASENLHLTPADDVMLLQIFVRMNYESYDFSTLDRFLARANLTFSRNWRARWQNDLGRFDNVRVLPVIVEFKRKALVDNTLGSWIDSCISGRREIWCQNTLSRDLIRRVIEEWTISNVIVPITYHKDTSDEFCAPYEIELFFYWLRYIRFADTADARKMKDYYFNTPFYFALFFDPEKIRDPLKKLRNQKILPPFLEKDYFQRVDEYREYMLGLKALGKAESDRAVANKHAIEYTILKIKEWNKR